MSEDAPSALQVQYDTASQTLTITTPGGCQIVIHDGDQALTLTDSHGNRAQCDSSGIRLESAGNFTLHAQGDLSLSAGGKLDIAAKGDIKAHGLNLALAADVGLSAKGNATAELSASGQTTVKGAMVLIN